jgi:hypothetical protein
MDATQPLKSPTRRPRKEDWLNEVMLKNVGLFLGLTRFPLECAC